MSSVEYFNEGIVEDLGIGPIGIVLGLTSLLVSLFLSLNPNSATYDIGIGLFAAIGVILFILSYAIGGVVIYKGMEPNINWTLGYGVLGASVLTIMMYVLKIVPIGYSTLTSSAIIALGLPAITEELVFRAGLMQIFYVVFGKTKKAFFAALVLQSIFFGAYHFAKEPDLQYTFVLFFGGLIFGIIFYISKNILSAMIAHAITNYRPLWLSIFTNPVVLISASLGIIVAIILRRNS